MSIITWVAPALFFLLTMEESSNGSIPRGCSICINKSSAGARSRAPPQTRQPPVFPTILLMSDSSSSTGMSISALSAVPEGEVMAREEVLGMVSPAAATTGTAKRLVLSPGIPPILCLSHTIPPKERVDPVSTIASINELDSLTDNPLKWIAVTKEASSRSFKFLSTTSCMISLISSAVSSAPSIL